MPFCFLVDQLSLHIPISSQSLPLPHRTASAALVRNKIDQHPGPRTENHSSKGRRSRILVIDTQSIERAFEQKCRALFSRLDLSTTHNNHTLALRHLNDLLLQQRGGTWQLSNTGNPQQRSCDDSAGSPPAQHETMPAISRAHAFSSCSTTSQRQRTPDWNEPSTVLCHEAQSNERSRRPDAQTQKQRLSLSRSRTWTTRPWQSLTVLMWAILFGLLLCCPGADAEYVQVAKPLERERSALLFDRSEPPIPAPRVRLEKRQEQESISATPSFIPAPTAAGEASSSLFGIQTATSSPQDDLPTPFDTSLGNNFTSPSCPAFFKSFLSNSTFQDCLPFSLLLQVYKRHPATNQTNQLTTSTYQTSNSFFTTSRSRVSLTHTLDATCSIPNLERCVATMSSLAAEIQSPSTCGADFDMENPQVRQAYSGFVAYQPLYHAGCLTNAAGDYCFAEAVHNASSPSAAYAYYLPLGVGLPGSAKPTCNRCLRDTMAVFALYAGDKAQPLSKTYGNAAEQLDGSCGSQFVEAAKVSTNAASTTPVRSAFCFALLMGLVQFFV